MLDFNAMLAVTPVKPVTQAFFDSLGFAVQRWYPQIPVLFFD
jgi:hypothetical protein